LKRGAEKREFYGERIKTRERDGRRGGGDEREETGERGRNLSFSLPLSPLFFPLLPPPPPPLTNITTKNNVFCVWASYNHRGREGERYKRERVFILPSTTFWVRERLREGERGDRRS
jgi:hypothetical protein